MESPSPFLGGMKLEGIPHNNIFLKFLTTYSHSWLDNGVGDILQGDYKMSKVHMAKVTRQRLLCDLWPLICDLSLFIVIIMYFFQVISSLHVEMAGKHH